MAAHAKLSPSKAHIWLACPGSVRMSAGLPDEPSDAARLGTACHAALKDLLEGRGLPAAVNVDGKLIFLSEEMEDWVRRAAEWVTKYLKDHPGTRLECEKEVHVDDDLWGTADIVLRSLDTLVIADAKFGHGEVEAEDNPQLGIYAMAEAGDVPRVGLVILQPRSEEPVKEEWLTGQDLAARGIRYYEGAQAALAPDAPLHASPEACRYCPAQAVCPEAQREALALARQEFSLVPEKLDRADLSALLAKAKFIRQALDAVEKYALAEATVGRDVPGWKRVAGRAGNRVWEAGAEKRLTDTLPLLTDAPFSLYGEPVMKSPAALEKELHMKSGALDAFTSRPEGSPVLVPDSDPRPALKPEFGTVDAKDSEE